MSTSAESDYEVGLFPTKDDAHYAIQDLLANGLARKDIQVADHRVPADLETGGDLGNPSAWAGLVEGAIYGGILGALIGIGYVFIAAASTIAITPIEWTVTGVVVGGFIGAIAGLTAGRKIPKVEAEDYAAGIHEDATVIAVKVTERNRGRVAAILDRDGAVDVEPRGENHLQDGFPDFSNFAAAG